MPLESLLNAKTPNTGTYCIDFAQLRTWRAILSGLLASQLYRQSAVKLCVSLTAKRL